MKVYILRKPPGEKSSKYQEQVNKGGCIKTEKNRLSAQFDSSTTFSM